MRSFDGLAARPGELVGLGVHPDLLEKDIPEAAERLCSLLEGRQGACVGFCQIQHPLRKHVVRVDEVELPRYGYRQGVQGRVSIAVAAARRHGGDVARDGIYGIYALSPNHCYSRSAWWKETEKLMLCVVHHRHPSPPRFDRGPGRLILRGRGERCIRASMHPGWQWNMQIHI